MRLRQPGSIEEWPGVGRQREIGLVLFRGSGDGFARDTAGTQGGKAHATGRYNDDRTRTRLSTAPREDRSLPPDPRRSRGQVQIPGLAAARIASRS